MLQRHSESIVAGASLIGTIIAAIGVWFIWVQLEQANNLKKWENYNAMNQRYYEWYMSTPEVADTFKCEAFELVDERTKRWVRSYFHLYSEEYWLYQNKLIPEEMWTKRIDGGVSVNLENYPILVSGYKYWKDLGSFSHPDDFVDIVDNKLLTINTQRSCRIENEVEEIMNPIPTSEPNNTNQLLLHDPLSQDETPGL